MIETLLLPFQFGFMHEAFLIGALIAVTPQIAIVAALDASL